jgi:hypothetical protein
MIEDEIRLIVVDEVKRQISPVYREVEALRVAMRSIVIPDPVHEEIPVKVVPQETWEQKYYRLKAEVDAMPRKTVVSPPPVRRTAVAPPPVRRTPPPEEAPDLYDEVLDWKIEQQGDLDKGETQIWRYGNHALTVWTEGQKTFAQVDDESAEELWKQSDLEKIQKRIEKMEQ